MEAEKRDLLVYKQTVLELKTVLKTKKDRKMRKAITAEIVAVEDIIKTLLRSGVPDLPLPKEIELQIIFDTSKQGKQPGTKPGKSQTTTETVEVEEIMEDIEEEEDRMRIEVLIMVKEGKEQMRWNQRTKDRLIKKIIKDKKAREVSQWKKRAKN